MEHEELKELEARLSPLQREELARIRERMEKFQGVPLQEHPECEEPAFGSGHITADMVR